MRPENNRSGDLRGSARSAGLVLTVAAGFPNEPAHPCDSAILPATSSKATTCIAARAAVDSVGGTVTQELDIIRAVVADVTSDQLSRLRASNATLRLHPNRAIEISAKGGTVAVAGGWWRWRWRWRW